MPKTTKKPPKVVEVPVTIRFPPDVHAKMVTGAAADERSINQYVVRAVKAQLDREGRD